MLALNFLRIFFANRVLVSLDMTFVGAPAIGIIARDTKRLQQGFQLQKDTILAPAEHIGQHLPCAVINGMPKPAWMRFARHIGPHFVELRAQPTTPCKLILSPYLYLDLPGI